MSFKLTLYKRPQLKEVEKTLEVRDCDISLGSLMDLLGIVDLSQKKERTKAEDLKLIKMFFPIMQEIFSELSDDDIHKIKLKDMQMIIANAVEIALSQVGDSDNEGNA